MATAPNALALRELAVGAGCAKAAEAENAEPNKSTDNFHKSHRSMCRTQRQCVGCIDSNWRNEK